jgi:methylamine---glutamate N-methyltransferase subunit B
MAEIDATGLSSREVNAAMRKLITEGCNDITLLNPGARHNLAVAVLSSVRIRIAGSAGYYCGGLGDGASIEVEGSAGWGLAESMLSGSVRVRGNAGSGAAAALRNGRVVIHRDAAARLGVSMKGGEVIVAGNCGYMAGFMAQKGTLVVCGNAEEAFADSMYATVCYVGGKIASLGTDAVLSTMEPGECDRLDTLLSANLPAEIRRSVPAAEDFKKVVAGRKLWNFDQREWRVWQEAL